MNGEGYGGRDKKWLKEDMENLARTFDRKMDKHEKLYMLMQDAAERSMDNQRNRFKKMWRKNRDRRRSEGKSLGIMNKNNRFRRAVHSIVHTDCFEITINLLIFANCLCLVTNSPQYFDYIFTSIFFAEMLLKIIADGVVSTPIFANRRWSKVPVNSTARSLALTNRLIFDRYQFSCYQTLLYIRNDIKRTERQKFMYSDSAWKSMNVKVEGDKLQQHQIQSCLGTLREVVKSTDNYTLCVFKTTSGEFRLLFYDPELWAITENLNKYDEGLATAEDLVALEQQASDEQSPRHPNHHCQTIYVLVGEQLKGIWKPFLGLKEKFASLPADDFENILLSSDLTDKRQNAYLADGWNRVDAFVVATAIFAIFNVDNRFASFKALRAIRPLRLAIRLEKIRVVIEALIGAIPGMMGTVVFCVLFWAILAIIGVNAFSGKFARCECIPSKVKDIENEFGANWCEDYARYNVSFTDCAWDLDLHSNHSASEFYSSNYMQWGNANFNFDNIAMAMQSIFIISTLDMWPNIMYDAIDATGINMAPIRNHNQWVSLYFVVVVILASFLSSNLIISVIVDNFNKIKQEKEGSAFLTKDQELWMRTRRLTDKITLVKKKDVPINDFRKKIFYIVENDNFEPIVLLSICLNCLTMTMERYNMGWGWINALQIVDIFFIILFTIEAKMKIYAYGWFPYWSEAWNRFDFIIVVISLIGLIAQAGLGLNFVRVFRIGRVLRLINKADSLRTMFFTLWYAFPAFWNIGLLLSVIFFMYAVFGMEIFGDIAFNDYIDKNANFTNFWISLTLLWRLATGDEWANAYMGCTEQHPDCRDHGTCGNPALAAIYFLSFNIFGSLVLINLFIAVILEMFTEGVESQKQEKFLKSVHVWKFLWEDLDHKRKGELDVQNFIHTLLSAPKPAGLSTMERARQFREDTLQGRKRRNTFRKLTGRKEKEEFSFHNVLKHFEKIKLLVHKKEGVSGKSDSWYVSYDECVIALGTMIVGPKIEAPVKDPDREMSFVDWYRKKFQVRAPPVVQTDEEED